MSNLVAQLRERGNGDIADGYEDKTERGQLDLQVADELTALQTEFEAVRAERVQLETLAASRAAEIHRLNNELTSVTLERDNAIRDAREHYGKYIEVCAALRNLLEVQK